MACKFLYQHFLRCAASANGETGETELLRADRIRALWARIFTLPWLTLYFILFANVGWSFGEDDLQTIESGLAHPAGSGIMNKTPHNDPFLIPPDIEGPAGGSIDTSGRADAGEKDCDTPEEKGEKPRIAVIIDDMGNQQRIGGQLLDLDLNLTFSFLPYAPFTREQQEEAWARGHDVLVHMPMEPRDSQWDPGPDALRVDDSLEQLTAAVEKNLALVPYAIGVNNHMGSLFTEDRAAMHRFLGIIRQKGMFFVDSGTTAASTGMEEAHDMGIKTAKRHVFLDNVQTREDICCQFKELIGRARQNGWAVGIGHPNDATLAALVSCRDILLENGRMVGINELVH